VLKAKDDKGSSRMELYRNGILKHGYLAKHVPRHILDFKKAIADSYREDATFMNAILLARFFPDRSIIIHNLTIEEAKGASSNLRDISDYEELGQLILKYFGIPREMVWDVLNGLELRYDAWN
jgi:hypothetical protein